MKSIHYDIVETRQVAIPSDANYEDLNDYDILYAKSRDLKYHVDICIDADYYLSETITYEKMPDFSNGKGGRIKTIIKDDNGIRMYDYSDNLISENTSLSGHQLSESDIEDYGFVAPNILDLTTITQLESGGNLVFNDDDQNTHVLNDLLNTEMIYNESGTDTKQIYYHSSGDPLFSYEKRSIQYQGYQIPWVDIDRKYKVSASGSEFLIKTYKEYISYQVIFRNNDVVHYQKGDTNHGLSSIVPKDNDTSSDRPSDLQIGKYDSVSKPIVKLSVYPNPTMDKVTIDIPVYAQNGLVNIEIVDAMGKKVYHISNLDMNTQLPIDISGYNPGVYYVNSISKGILKTTKFIKL